MSLLIGGTGVGGKLIITGIRKQTPKSYKTSSSTIKLHKKLQYNHREVSAMILRAKTAFSASLAVSSARTKLVSLSKKAGTGEYDEEELRHAIIHAQSIVRVAKKRLKHLKQEEAEKKVMEEESFELEEEEKKSDLEEVEEENSPESEREDSQKMSAEELQKLMREIEKLMREVTEEDEDSEEDILEEFSFVKDVEPQELELRKKKHRADELKDIVKADMKYLKFVFGRLESERNNMNNGVSLEIGGLNIPVSSPPPVAVEGGNVDVSL